MSATSYRPACASVQNTGKNPLALGVKLGFIKDNRFLFDYEHSKIIYDRCLDHISACQLSARCFRILNIILRQTVGFGKLEDHATTTRLEQLTKIRHDHIGNTLRYLAKRNIIKWRKGGKYNNYLSINYDFASWGERRPDRQNPNNDPTILLPDYYVKTPVDQGLCFDDDQEDNALFDTDSSLEETIQTEQEITSDEPNTSIAETAKYLDKDSVVQLVTEVLDDKFSEIKQLLKQNTATETVLETASEIAQTDQLNSELAQKEQAIKTYQEEIATLKQQSKQEIIALKQQSKQEISDLKQQSEQEITEVKQQSEKIQLENNRLHEKQIETHVQNQAPDYSISRHSIVQDTYRSPDSTVMDYPLQLSENDHISAKNIVMKSPDKAQDILDLLAIRLNQPQPVLNNPMAYLARLVQKEQQNELDFSALQTFVRPQVIQRDLRKLINIHNSDYGQYQAYGEAVKSYDFQPDDPDSVIAMKRIEDQYSESFDTAQDSYNVLKQYVAEYQLDENILQQVDSYKPS